jgi:hypothetical protein
MIAVGRRLFKRLLGAMGVPASLRLVAFRDFGDAFCPALGGAKVFLARALTEVLAGLQSACR